MLVQYVQPLFASPVGHLRAKAAWVSGTFADIKFSAGRGIGPHFNALFQANVHALRDPDLPVRNYFPPPAPLNPAHNFITCVETSFCSGDWRFRSPLGL